MKKTQFKQALKALVCALVSGMEEFGLMAFEPDDGAGSLASLRDTEH